MKAVRIGIGMLLFGIVFYLANGVLVRKSYYMDSISRFLTSSDIEVDVIGFGSSHMYCTMNPIELFRYTKLRSYVICTQQQPAEITYDYIKRALTFHRPKVILLETYMFFCQATPTMIGAGVAHDALDPIPMDWDKCQMVFSSQYLTNPDSIIMPFLKYHSRWKGLECSDWKLRTVPSKHDYSIMGFRLFGNVVSNEVRQIDWESPPAVLDEYYVGILDRIARLASSQGARLVLLTAPYSPLSDAIESRICAIDEYARNNGIPHINLFRDFDRVGIDVNDFHDRGHLNVWGSEKATRYIGEKLCGNFNLKAEDNLEKLAIWSKECRRYDEMMAILKRRRN